MVWGGCGRMRGVPRRGEKPTLVTRVQSLTHTCGRSDLGLCFVIGFVVLAKIQLVEVIAEAILVQFATEVNIGTAVWLLCVCDDSGLLCQCPSRSSTTRWENAWHG